MGSDDTRDNCVLNAWYAGFFEPEMKGDFKSEYPFASCQAYQVKLTCREGPCRFQSWFAPEETSNHRAINHQYDYVHDVDASATEGSGAGLCVGGVLMHIGALMLMLCCIKALFRCCKRACSSEEVVEEAHVETSGDYQRMGRLCFRMENIGVMSWCAIVFVR